MSMSIEVVITEREDFDVDDGLGDLAVRNRPPIDHDRPAKDLLVSMRSAFESRSDTVNIGGSKALVSAHSVEMIKQGEASHVFKLHII